MSNGGFNVPVSSPRRKKAEEALFRESMGFDEEEAFQQAMGQQQVEDRTQSWQSPTDATTSAPTTPAWGGIGAMTFLTPEQQAYYDALTGLPETDIPAAQPAPIVPPEPVKVPTYRPTPDEETPLEKRAREFQQETSPYPVTPREETPFAKMKVQDPVGATLRTYQEQVAERFGATISAIDVRAQTVP